MRQIIIGIIVLGVGGALVFNVVQGNRGQYVAGTHATTTVEVSPQWATDEDAVRAAQDVIKKKELEAEEARLVDEITSKQDELDAIRKELGSY